MNCNIIPLQQHLQPALPTVKGNVDYQDWVDQLDRIDGLLTHTGVQSEYVQLCVQNWLRECAAEGHRPSAKEQM